MTLNQVPAQPIACAQSALEIDPGPHLVVGQPGPLQRSLNDVTSEAAGDHLLDREASPVYRDAFAEREALVGARDGELQSVFGTPHRSHSPNRCHDSGKHGSRSRTRRVSDPNDLRSTTRQGFTCSSETPGSPWMAGILPSPNHSGLRTR